MITVRLPEELDKQLDNIAQKTHRSKSFYIRKAIQEYLEDHQDYLDAVARLEENNERIPYEEARKQLKLNKKTSKVED